MGLSMCMLSKVAVIMFQLVVANSLYSLLQRRPSCDDEDSSALLLFKQSFVIDRPANSYYYDSAYPKVLTWKSPHEGENNTCCSWDGVECDEKTGHVIGLDLSNSCLHGSINSTSSLFRLVHLRRLNLAYNNFSYSTIPTTITNLRRLRYLELSDSVFSGHFPSEVLQLSKLLFLDLSLNNFNGPISASLSNLSQLNTLWLYGNQLTGSIPSFLSNRLTEIDLSWNKFHGSIPSCLGNLSRLTEIDLSWNYKLHGSIPESFSNLTNLQKLFLQGNALSGTVDFHMFLKLENLIAIRLGENNLDLITDSRTMNETAPQFTVIGLGSCNIREFPVFLRYQENLVWLRLSENEMHGKIPVWMGNTSINTLEIMDVSKNSLSGFDHRSIVLPWVNLQLLDLSSNMLHGPLPIPRQNTKYYGISDNKLTGEISSLICNLTSLLFLDLSHNKLSGMLPQCLGNFSVDLQVLNLCDNSFHGFLPHTYTRENNMVMIDVSQNQLQGKIPRTLVNSVMLEFLVLSNNNFSDVFPFWLGTLPKLKVLVLRSNRFHGVVIGNPGKEGDFLKLHILDLSHNNFAGEFPSEFIFSANAMRHITLSNLTYMITNFSKDLYFNAPQHYDYSITLINKGVERYYQKIHEQYAVIDISSNKFEGNIPGFIGKLQGLRSLNISNNIFKGCIPSSLGNLTVLESLDLSHNKLSGVIPQQLTQLTFLEQFNVSHNNLKGPIPHGTQLTTFDITSFGGNSGLCGDPLPNKCGSSSVPPPPQSSIHKDDSGPAINLDWKFVLAGVVSGFVVGVVLADFAITVRHEWFTVIVEILITQMKKIRVIMGRIN